MDARTPTEIKRSVCPLDCPDTCSLSVTTAGGELLEVKGSTDNPYTAGVICNKVARSYPEFVHGRNRLTHPLRLTGPRGSGEFERISWDAALDLIHDGIAKAIDVHGPQSVLPFNYSGPHGELAVGSMDRRFFHKMGASLVNRGPLCGIVRGSAYDSLFGTAPGMDPEQARHADLIVIWGNNITVSNLHLTRVIKKAKQDGAKLIVIDPKRIKIAEQADLHLQIEPGTDVVLGLALAAEFERRGGFDRAFIDQWVDGLDAYMAEARKYTLDQVASVCKLPLGQVETMIEWYMAAKTVAVSVANGIERGRSGGSGIRAAMALQALTGNHGRLGAGVFAKPGYAFPKTTDRLQRPDLIPDGTRTVNIVDVPELILDENLDPPIRAAFIYNHNPVATHPNQNRMIEALSHPDLFVAGADIAMTDSMAYCDVVLPATSHFEHNDLYGAYGTSYLQRAEPVIPAVGEAQPNTEIFRRLAARFGYDEPMFTDDDHALMDAAMDGADPRLKGYRPSAIPVDAAFLIGAEDGAPLVLCDNHAPGTGTGKIELFSRNLEDRFGYGVPRFEPVERDLPFSIISPSSSKRTNATFGGCSESQGMEIVEINPADAEDRGIAEGDTLKIWNARGEVHLSARVTDAVRPGVLYSPKGTWRATSPTGQTVNALIPSDMRADIEEGAVYNETFVDVAKLA
ncbi:MAG: molybdopterin-dependent oxidoreductase [Magnetovibrio sp.]|nr:molybdopterin-dependent oxidoreductase [Magnetovibrio sp.]